VRSRHTLAHDPSNVLVSPETLVRIGIAEGVAQLMWRACKTRQSIYLPAGGKGACRAAPLAKKWWPTPGQFLKNSDSGPRSVVGR